MCIDKSNVLYVQKGVAKDWEKSG